MRRRSMPVGAEAVGGAAGERPRADQLFHGSLEAGKLRLVELFRCSVRLPRGKMGVFSGSMLRARPRGLHLGGSYARGCSFS